MNEYFTLLKFPNGAYYMWTGQDSVGDVLFTGQGIKSKGSTVVVPFLAIRATSMGIVKRDLEQKLKGPVDRIFVAFSGRDGIRQDLRRMNALKKELGITFRGITKRVLLFDIDTWLENSGMTENQLSWAVKVFEAMVKDNRFLLGQIKDRRELTQMKEHIKVAQANLENRIKDLNNIQPNEELNKVGIKNILRMKWIDKLDLLGDGSLRILTKPIACTYVENIGNYVPYEDIVRSDVLYRMMKYQALGKYFIIQPDYYLVSPTFDIRADSNDIYPMSKVRKVMINSTYFHGQACHIGNGSACHGELAAAISGAGKNGLDMLLMSLEAYLRSINLPDAAGQRYYCLPMGDKDGNIEVWPYIEPVLKNEHVSLKGRERNLETYEWALSQPQMEKYFNTGMGKYFDGSCQSFSDSRRKENMNKCLELIKMREPDVYAEIMARKERGETV